MVGGWHAPPVHVVACTDSRAVGGAEISLANLDAVKGYDLPLRAHPVTTARAPHSLADARSALPAEAPCR
jgi:hypothetical protein